MKNISEKDNLEEYDDPLLYDLENEAFKDDIPFLMKWADKTKGPIIDLACGTGRATIPLAAKGHKLIGIDLHRGMLEKAKEKSSELDLQIDWLKQDCTRLDIGVKSRMIFMVGNSFQHFLTKEAQDSLLSSIYRHLDTGGVFIFGTRFPGREELLQPEEEEFWKTYQDPHTFQNVDVYTISRYDSLSQVQHYTTIRKLKNTERETVEEKRTNISLRYVYPKEMERTLLSNGLQILHTYKDWKETPLTQDSYQMIYVCKKL
ncbi:class I SAM-dependent DNA methyltransferase [Sutcliffiella deserti]|uniref:class I SAM-dependent DNA methyltransferase n=1 Tax=Sutcliffiella deserti TaxID=2875501 RepID=UPI001CBD8DEF|nr:class I SAM-dependent methyltransferase [Sutcliffiella deserti]